MNYYNEIKGKLIKCEIYDKVRDYSKERNRINTYFEVGKILSEAGKHYGENIIGHQLFSTLYSTMSFPL